MSYELADGSLSTDYKIGELFVYNDPRGEHYGSFHGGSIVKFFQDDGSECPLFSLHRGSCLTTVCMDEDDCPAAYASWEKLTRYSGTFVTKEQDPEVAIRQSEVDAYIDEINMLRELVAEITLQSDSNSLEQQAEAFRVLNEKMLKHQSYKQGDGGSTREGELLEQLDTLFAAYDSLAGKRQFEPVSEMSLEDWQQAERERWVFQTEHRGLVNVYDVDHQPRDLTPILLEDVNGDTWYVCLDGGDIDREGWTVVKRVK